MTLPLRAERHLLSESLAPSEAARNAAAWAAHDTKAGDGGSPGGAELCFLEDEKVRSGKIWETHFTVPMLLQSTFQI